MAGPLLAYDIRQLERNPDYAPDELEDGLGAAPYYERFADAGKLVIRTIHSIPHLWEDWSLGEVEVYLGRAGATPQHVLNRWSSHRTGKGHQHGVVIVECDTNVVEAWERGANRIIRRLRDDGRLCVKNAAASGQGALPRVDTSCIYVTWKRTREVALEPADRRYLEDVAHEAAAHLRPEITLDQVRRAIDPLSRPQRDRAELVWHMNHQED